MNKKTIKLKGKNCLFENFSPKFLNFRFFLENPIVRRFNPSEKKDKEFHYHNNAIFSSTVQSIFPIVRNSNLNTDTHRGFRFIDFRRYKDLKNEMYPRIKVSLV